MKSDLVVFYSRSGNTRRLAQRLAHALDADLEEVREARGRDGMLGFLRCGYEATRGIEPPLLPLRLNPRRYARVFIGTPVWAGHVSSPVRAWLARHRADLKEFAFFCTYGHEGADTALADLAAIVGRAPQATLAMTEREVHLGGEAQVAPFVESLPARAKAA